MAENRFSHLSDTELLTIVQTANGVISVALGAYGTSAAQDAALAAAVTDLSTGIAGADAARVASRAATQSKLTARQGALTVLGSIGATMYNDPAVTPDMLAEVGYAVHDDVPTKHFAVQPLSLTVDPDEFGTVTLEWDGNGNTYPAVYVVEGRASDSDPWTVVTNTTRKRIKVPGFTPGATHYFRVYASHNGQVSIASNIDAIWLPTEEVVLEIAA